MCDDDGCCSCIGNGVGAGGRDAATVAVASVFDALVALSMSVSASVASGAAVGGGVILANGDERGKVPNPMFLSRC